jgi:tetratricopeptide (TPR) repeat protein
MENHATASLVWHALNIKGATLVHLDAHDDCRYVPPEKLRQLQELLARRDYETIFRRSDIGPYLNFDVSPEQSLYDLGNFIYPCLMDGTVSNFLWVVPNKTLDRSTRQGLQLHLQKVLHLSAPLTDTADTPNRFSFALSNCTVTVTTLNAMPNIGAGAILDIDADFFLFPVALSKTHLLGDFIWDPADVCSNLIDRIPDPAAVTICSSVWGGYLPLLYRFIPEAGFESLVTGRYPAYASELQRSVDSVWRGVGAIRHISEPDDPAFRPAYDHLNAVFLLMKGKEDEATSLIQKAAKASPVYAKGLLDTAEGLTYMGRFEAAHEKIDKFDHVMGRETFPSLMTRAFAYLEEGRSQDAEPPIRRLLAWDRQPSTLLLHAGELTQQRKHAEAMAIYREIVTNAPNNAAVYYDMGVLTEEEKKPDQAIALYRQALSLRPNFGKALEHLGYLLLTDKNDTRGAVDTLRKATQVNPLSITALNNLGLALSRQGQFDESIRCYERALMLNPDMAEIHANFGLALAQAGRSDEAVLRYREALRLKPNWREIADALSRLLRQNEHP